MGARALMDALVAAGAQVCFANPGTSELHLVSAMAATPGFAAMLCLDENVATGAADGYYRMSHRPAVTLLHLGPGLANGWSNLHNARRAGSGVLSIVGDHSTDHLALNAPLTSDLDGLAASVSDAVLRSSRAETLAETGQQAYAAASTGRIVTLAVPADHAWAPEPTEASSETARQPGLGAEAPHWDEPTPPSDEQIEAAVQALLEGDGALFLGGQALQGDALELAGLVAAATGARLICETFPARIQRGAGRVTPERLPYLAPMATMSLAPLRSLVYVGASEPVAFFGHPGHPGRLAPPGAAEIILAGPRGDHQPALDRLAKAVLARVCGPLAAAVQPPCGSPALPSGPLTTAGLGAAIAATMPAQTIVSDESATAAVALYPATAGAAPHDWLTLTGGSIGQGLPVALGAAIACPGRPVLALQADGGAMYAPQALWSMAREKANATVVIINNGRYAILGVEAMRLGLDFSQGVSADLIDLGRPSLDWVALATGLGVPGRRVSTAADLVEALEAAFAEPGPHLIDAVVS